MLSVFKASEYDVFDGLDGGVDVEEVTPGLTLCGVYMKLLEVAAGGAFGLLPNGEYELLTAEEVVPLLLPPRLSK